MLPPTRQLSLGTTDWLATGAFVLGKHSLAWECGLCGLPGSALSWGGGDLSHPAPPALPCWPVPCPGFPDGLLDFPGPPDYFPAPPDYFPALASCTAIPGGCPESDSLLCCLLRVESMSLADRGNPGNITSRLVEKKKARDCLIPMG